MRVSVFPNPANTNVSVSFDLPFESNIDLFITDITGKIFFDKNFGKLPKGKQTIVLSDKIKLSVGSYNFNFVFNGKYSAIEKVIIGE